MRDLSQRNLVVRCNIVAPSDGSGSLPFSQTDYDRYALAFGRYRLAKELVPYAVLGKQFYYPSGSIPGAQMSNFKNAYIEEFAAAAKTFAGQ
ncbi:MAG: hypothetical protein ACKVVP_04265 [Chloroflexota bacterium]